VGVVAHAVGHPPDAVIGSAKARALLAVGEMLRRRQVEAECSGELCPIVTDGGCRRYRARRTLRPARSSATTRRRCRSPCPPTRQAALFLGGNVSARRWLTLRLELADIGRSLGLAHGGLVRSRELGHRRDEWSRPRAISRRRRIRRRKWPTTSPREFPQLDQLDHLEHL